METIQGKGMITKATLIALSVGIFQLLMFCCLAGMLAFV
jgi:hypothetical protein